MMGRSVSVNTIAANMGLHVHVLTKVESELSQAKPRPCLLKETRKAHYVTMSCIDPSGPDRVAVLDMG